jgi:hypothetical protein
MACSSAWMGPYRDRRRTARGIFAALALLSITGCEGVKIEPPSFPECPPSCHAGSK